MRRRGICFAGLIALLLMGISSCNNGEVYYRYNEIKDLKWSKHDTLFFYIDSSLIKPGVNYDITIELTNNFDYPYRNIWLYVQDNISDTVFKNYPEEYPLADKFGKWEGSGFGALFQKSFAYPNPSDFNGRRNYCIKIVHGMRDEPLKGIEKVGIKIQERK